MFSSKNSKNHFTVMKLSNWKKFHQSQRSIFFQNLFTFYIFPHNELFIMKHVINRNNSTFYEVNLEK